MKFGRLCIKRPRGRWLILMFLLAALLALVLDYNLYSPDVKVGGVSKNLGHNGLWLRYTWYFGEHRKSDVLKLASQMRENQIRYAYFHVRSIKHDGRLNYHYQKNAQGLNTTLHKSAPEVKSIAWVYIGNPRGRGLVNLNKPAVRKQVIHEALWLVNECGFDGVQIDYEICPDEDPGFITLMHELRTKFPRSKILSVATALWIPGPLLRWGGWSDYYFIKIAGYCDQMAVMCYDSASYFPRAYVWLVHQQVIHITRAVESSGSDCSVIFGLPTYEDGTLSHNPHAENLKMAIKGVCEGISDPVSCKTKCEGIALFADYTTDKDEWRTYRKLWLDSNE